MGARDVGWQARTPSRWCVALVATVLITACGSPADSTLPTTSKGSMPSPTSAANRIPATPVPTTVTPAATQSAVVEPADPRPATHAPTATPASRPTATPRPNAAWTKLGAISTGSGGYLAGVSTFAGGYVAWGHYGKGSEDDPPFTTWFSPDGRTWERTVHATSIVPCPGWTARPDLESIHAPATDGRTLVFTATWLYPDEASCERAWMISLATTDGRIWTRSEPFAAGQAPSYWAVWAERTWAVPGGWETLVNSAADAVTIWRSTDLATWAQVASRPISDDPERDFNVVATSQDGTRLAVSTEEDKETSRSTLLASTDAVNWEPVRTLPAGFGVSEVVPPLSPERPWLVAIGRDDPEEARVLVSRDLATWTRCTFPKPGIRALTPTPSGWIATGFWPARDTGCGSSCRPTSPSLYSSADGVNWTERRGSHPPEATDILGGDGAGGVIAASNPDAAGKVTLWRLSAGS